PRRDLRRPARRGRAHERRADRGLAGALARRRAARDRLPLRPPSPCRVLPRLPRRLHGRCPGGPPERLRRARSLLRRLRAPRRLLGVEAPAVGHGRGLADRARGRRRRQRLPRRSVPDVRHPDPGVERPAPSRDGRDPPGPPRRRPAHVSPSPSVDLPLGWLPLAFIVAAAGATALGGIVPTTRARWDEIVLQYFVALGAGFMLAAVTLQMIPLSARMTTLAPPLILAGYLVIHLVEHTIVPHFHFGEETHVEARRADVGISA